LADRKLISRSCVTSPPSACGFGVMRHAVDFSILRANVLARRRDFVYNIA
jgi:hypothetical protein